MGILSVSFFDNRKLLADLTQLYIVLSAFGKECVYLVVICLNSGDKGCLRVAFPAFLVPVKLFGAVCGEAFNLVCGKRILYKMLIFVFFGNKVFPINMSHASLKRTAGTVDLVCKERVSVCGRDLKVDKRLVRCSKYELAVILCIAEGVASVHTAENFGHTVVHIHYIKRLIKRVRSCVCKVSAVEFAAALPVPAACVAVELNADLNQSAQHAGSDNFLYLFKIMGKSGLLEYKERSAVLFCNFAQFVKLLYCGNAGLFAQYVKAVSGRKDISPYIYTIKDNELCAYYENMETEPARSFAEERRKRYGKNFIQVDFKNFDPVVYK